MSEWDMNQSQTPQEPNETTSHTGEPTATPTPVSQPAAQPQQPVEQPAEQPQQPTTPTQPVPPNNRYATYTPYGSQWQPTGQGYRYPPQPPQQPPKSPKRHNGGMIALVAILSVMCLLCAILAVALVKQNNTSSGTQGSSTTTTNSAGGTTNSSGTSSSTGVNDGPELVISDSDGDTLTTAEIVARNLDCTVLINVYTMKTVSDSRLGYQGQTTQEETLAGQASGIVMSQDGYIITNEHVVVDDDTQQMYERVEVQLYNGSVYTAEVVAYDADTDLAVVKIDATGLSVATFGDSDAVALGDRVVTIGNSGGLPWSVSDGVLSGKNRDVYDETGYQIQCLQTNATINPGNSGGPLFNSKGEVIGINSAKIVYEGYENLGFSIPINEAQPIINDLIRYGKVTGRISLGITGYDFSQYGVTGFMVYSIDENSSLAGTEVAQQDIIIAVDDTTISGRTELRNQLSQHQDGDKVTLKLLRFTSRYEYTTFTVEVTLRADNAD